MGSHLRSLFIASGAGLAFFALYLAAWTVGLMLLPFLPGPPPSEGRLDFVIYRLGIPVYWSETGDLMSFHYATFTVIFLFSLLLWRRLMREDRGVVS